MKKLIGAFCDYANAPENRKENVKWKERRAGKRK
jgi:hypothetical protein